MRQVCIAILWVAIMFNNGAQAQEWCFEKDMIYPRGMFGQWSDKSQTASNKINQIFKFGKDTLSENPARMLYGLAYLEVMVNQLCFERHNASAAQSRKKIQAIVDDLRQSLGMPSDMSRQKMINIYWSTGRLLELAQVEKLNLDESRKENIALIREAKAALKATLREAKNDLE